MREAGNGCTVMAKWSAQGHRNYHVGGDGLWNKMVLCDDHVGRFWLKEWRVHECLESIAGLRNNNTVTDPSWLV